MSNTTKRKQIVAGSAEAQPWRVLLQVRPSLLATDLQPVVYYVRGRVDEVGNIAYLMWTVRLYMCYRHDCVTNKSTENVPPRRACDWNVE